MLVSVVVPVYNAEKFLTKCVGSVLAQSYERFELILVNDGSTDGSEPMCREYALKDSRIKLISQKNSGPAAARNMGVRHAGGEFVYFLDADDFICPDTLETLIAGYNETRADLVMANFDKLVNDDQLTVQRVSFSPENAAFVDESKILSRSECVDYVRHFLKFPSNHLISYCWARLYKLDVIRKNAITSNEKMRLFEDFVFNLDYLHYTNRLLFVNKPLHTYTMNTNHTSASMEILNAKSLLHDMSIFQSKTNAFLRMNCKSTDMSNLQKEVGHALMHYVIIFLVRSCRQINNGNKKAIYEEIARLCKASLIKECVNCYTPSKGNSRIVPLLIKLELVHFIMHTCMYKAFKRYGKPGG